MIFLYAFMIGSPVSSPFVKTTLEQYLKQLYGYYSSKAKIKNRLLLGGAGAGDGAGDGKTPLTHRVELDKTPNPSTTDTGSTLTPSYYGQFKNYMNDKLDQVTPYYGQFKNYVNDKLDQPLPINNSNKTIPVYYANPNLSYYVVVNLELFPGDKISNMDKRNLGCQIKFDNIRKSYADLLGYQYQPSLLNTNVMPSRIDTKSGSSTSSSSGNKSNSNSKNTTKKYRNGDNSKNKNYRNTRRYRG